MEEEEEEEDNNEQSPVTSGVPRGGPIYLTNTVNHQLSSISEFQSSLLNLLQDFESHLLLPSSSPHDDDLSIDSLKVYTEEELTSMAMKEAFKEDDDEVCENQLVIVPPHIENPSATSSRTTKRKRTVKKPAASLCNGEEDPSTETSRTTRSGKKTVKKPSCSKDRSVVTSRTRKGKKTVSKDDYLNKVEELAKLKQAQDEEKANLRLHCFSTTCEIGKDVVSTEGLEQMQSLKYIDNYTPPKPSDIVGQADALFPEVVLCVEIYDRRKVKTQEFLVLGREMLTDLKDKIQCITDQVMEKAGVYDHSGYFLIEDVFYNDLRNPSAVDYSKPILNWLWNSKDEATEKWQKIITGELKRKQKAVLGKLTSADLPPFGSALMESTRFCDLKFRLGANYIYCHQGDCKHMVVIRDMRLSHQEDVQNIAVYPRLVYQSKVRYRKCSVCDIYRASKFAVDVKWAPENPCYFCEICFAELRLEEDSVNCQYPIYDYLYSKET